MTNQEPASREIKTFSQMTHPSYEHLLNEQRVLIDAQGFMKLVKWLYRVELPRQTLQLYSSPRFKLLPPAVHKGGHVSYYLHPEHTERMGAVLYLRDKFHLPLNAIKQVMECYPAEYYHLILNGVLTGDELLDFPALVKGGFQVKDMVYYKIVRLLTMMDKDYWEFIGKEGQQAPRHIERELQQDLAKHLKDIGGWLRTDCRMEMHETLQNEWQRRYIAAEDAS